MEASQLQIAKEFLETLFAESVSDERLLTIFTVPGERSRRFSSCDAAAEYVGTLGADLSIYHGMGTVTGVTKGRGSAKNVSSITATWCDIDIRSDAHSSDKLPASIDEALEFLNGLPLKPSLVVRSGNGLHGYWLLDTPWIFVGENERQAAERLTKGWHGLVCDAARRLGWSLENLGDLARVLRTPGTVNPRTGSAVTYEFSGELHSKESLLALLSKPTTHYDPPRQAYSLLDRCFRYLDKIPPAIEGQAGGTQTLLACKAIYRFGLGDADARRAFDYYNSRCQPPWSIEKQIQHKLDDARKSVIAENKFGILANADEQQLQVDLSAILPKLVTPAVVDYDDEYLEPLPESPSFPDSLLSPGGLLGAVVDYILTTAKYRQPELALAAALTLVATVTGRKVTDCYGTRTNIYAIALGETGVGKEHARQVNKQLLLHAGGEKLIGSERVGSHAGIVNAVFESPALLMQLDELGRLMDTMKDPRKAPHLYNCVTVLMQLYSSSNVVWKADAYADSKKVRTIDQPHLVIYGTSTPDSFWNALSSENITEGLVGRLMAFEGRGYEIEMQEPGIGDHQSIAGALRSWLDFQPGGNLSREHPNPQFVPHSDDAKARFMGHVGAINSRRRKESKLKAALWSRSAEKAAKLALIHACSRGWNVPAAIELPDVEFGIALANWLTRRLLAASATRVSENETEARAKRVLRILNGHGLTSSQLTRRTQWLRGRERQEILKDLHDSGQIEFVQEETKGRSRTLIKAKLAR